MSFGRVAKVSFVVATLIASANAGESISLDRVEVTATRGAHDVDDMKINTRNATLVKDVMRDIPGVYIRGTNSMNQKIFVRGISDRGVNITIDGAKQTGNTFHHNADLFIDPELLKAVEISVGGKSVVNGGLGGSVAFKTVDASDLLDEGKSAGAKVKLGYATNNDEFSKGILLYAIPIANLDLLGAINHKGYNFGKSGHGVKTGGDGDDTNYLIKAGYRFLDSHRLSLSHERNGYKGQFPMRAEFPSWMDGRNAIAWRKYERTTSTLKHEYTPSALFNLETTIYDTEHRRLESDRTWGIKTKGASLKAKTKFETGAATHTLRYGAEYYESENHAEPLSPTPEKIKDYALFIEDAIQFGALTLTPGLRYENYALHTYKGVSPKQNRTGLSDYKYKFDKLTQALALDYEIGKGFGAFASYAKVFQGPDMLEGMTASGFVRPTGTWTPNDNLKPMTGDNYEIGGRYKGKINDTTSLNVSAKYFLSRYKNLVSSYEEYAARRNVGGADVDGIELFIKANVAQSSFALGYTKQDIKYKDRIVKIGKGGVRSWYRSDMLGFRDSGDKYTFNVEQAIPELDLLIGYNLLYFASESVDDVSAMKTIDLPSYSVSDFYITYAPSRGLLEGMELNAGIYNAFNKAYSAHSQRNADFYSSTNTSREWEAGRNVKLSVSYRF